ncbi:MAG TPA: hypothetical protein VMP89_11585 [Solirubrobacteraceae bacterium]|nr:hypothetical protein [Solirubrobacteraceae bacterium]
MAQADGHGECGEQQELRDQPDNRTGVDRPPYLSTALPVVARSGQSMVCDDLTASRRENRVHAAVVRSGWGISSNEGRETIIARFALAWTVPPIAGVLCVLIVASVPANATSCQAPSVERTGSWMLELHAPKTPAPCQAFPGVA